MASITVKSNPAALQAIAELAKKTEVKVGFIERLEYDNGISVAQVAYGNEFGVKSRNIPPRPFMRPAADENGIKWAGIMKRQAKLVAKGSMTMADAMDRLGQDAAGQVRKSISRVMSPKLADATIAARARRYISAPKKGGAAASSKPLIDTGKMLASVDYEVSQ